MSLTIHTNLGDLKVELECEKCPIASENFLALCASEYFNGTQFHRLIPGFIVQGGDPTGTGQGGSSVYGKPFPDEIHDSLKYDRRGRFAMANGGPNTNQSQFFITLGAQEHLNQVYTLFATVIDGFEVLDAIDRIPVDDNDVPRKPIVFQDVTIHANPFADGSIASSGHKVFAESAEGTA